MVFEFEEKWKHITQHDKVKIWYEMMNENLDEYMKEAVLLYHKELETELSPDHFSFLSQQKKRRRESLQPCRKPHT